MKKIWNLHKNHALHAFKVCCGSKTPPITWNYFFLSSHAFEHETCWITPSHTSTPNFIVIHALDVCLSCHFVMCQLVWCLVEVTVLTVIWACVIQMAITFDLEDFRSCSGESFSPSNHPESISRVKTMIFNDAWPLSAKTRFFRIWIFEFQKNS